MADINTMKFGDLVTSLDPDFDAKPEFYGAVRLLAALAEKSTVAQTVLDALLKGTVEALSELGLTQAAKDVDEQTAVLADLWGGDEGQAEDPELKKALNAVVEAAEDIRKEVNMLAKRVENLEIRRGISRGRDWDNTMLTTKDDEYLWRKTAFDFNA